MNISIKIYLAIYSERSVILSRSLRCSHRFVSPMSVIGPLRNYEIMFNSINAYIAKSKERLLNDSRQLRFFPISLNPLSLICQTLNWIRNHNISFSDDLLKTRERVFNFSKHLRF